MLKLTPNIYRTRAQQLLSAQNIIDTVKMHPIDNSMEDTSVFYTVTLDEVTIDGQAVKLPISNTVPSTHYRAIDNEYWNGILHGDDQFAKSRVDCYMLQGETVCTADKLALGTPSVRITLQGTSHVVARGGSTYGSYPSVDTLKNSEWSSASWIEGASTSTEETLTHDYTNTNIAFNPWIRNIVPTPNKPTANDVITEWVGAPGGIWSQFTARYDAWAETSNYNSDTFETFRMYSPNGLNLDIEKKSMSTIQMVNKNIKQSATVEQLGDYEYKVTWSIPLRFAYIAAARERRPESWSDVDNYAYLDKITKITIELSSRPLDTSVVEIVYGMNNAGTLTPEAPGKHILDVDAGETFTLATRFYNKTLGLIQWTEALPILILSKYKNGKYTFECDVPAAWAIKKQVTINTQVQIQLLDGSLIERDGTVCTFSVKNINKKYEQNAFTFTLSLIEE